MEEVFDLGESRVDAHDRGAPLREQVLAEPAAPIHLDEQPAQLDERLVAGLAEHPALAAKRSGLRAPQCDPFDVRPPAMERRHAEKV